MTASGIGKCYYQPYHLPWRPLPPSPFNHSLFERDSLTSITEPNLCLARLTRMRGPYFNYADFHNHLLVPQHNACYATIHVLHKMRVNWEKNHRTMLTTSYEVR